MKKFLQEFEDFIMRGNVLDLAVAVVIGAAFGQIVSSFVANILMPPIGLLLGGVDFSDLKLVLQPATDKAPEVVLGYGSFLQTVVDFLIISAAVFLVVKFVNRFTPEKRKEAPPAPSSEEKLLTEIRDLLRSR